MSSFPAWVRFSSDTLPTDPDSKTTLGIGIKLFGVPGEKLLGDGDTHDFILQNFDIFFVDTAKDMCEFTRAGVVDGNLPIGPASRRTNGFAWMRTFGYLLGYLFNSITVTLSCLNVYLKSEEAGEIEVSRG